MEVQRGSADEGSHRDDGGEQPRQKERYRPEPPGRSSRVSQSAARSHRQNVEMQKEYFIERMRPLTQTALAELHVGALVKV